MYTTMISITEKHGDERTMNLPFIQMTDGLPSERKYWLCQWVPFKYKGDNTSMKCVVYSAAKPDNCIDIDPLQSYDIETIETSLVLGLYTY